MRWTLGVLAGWLTMSFTASVIPMLTMAVGVGYMHLMVESVSPEGKADWMAGNMDKVMENYWVIAYHAWGIGALLAGWVLIRVTRTDNGFAVVVVSLMMGAYAGLNYWSWPGSVGPFLVVSVLFFIGAYIADQRRQKASKSHATVAGDDVARTD